MKRVAKHRDALNRLIRLDRAARCPEAVLVPQASPGAPVNGIRQHTPRPTYHHFMLQLLGTHRSPLQPKKK